MNPGSGLIREGTFPGDIAYHVACDTSGGVSVSFSGLPDASNPRNCYVVAYVDKAATPSGTNNTNVFKIIAVGGTPSGTPADPTVGQIQASAVGATNPYYVLARVRLGTGATLISTAMIDDLRTMTSPRVGNGGVPAAALATNAITLSSVKSSTSQGSISATPVILTGLTTTVTIPSGGRTVRIEAFLPWILSTTACHATIAIYNSATVTGLPTQTSLALIAVAGTKTTAFVFDEYVPAAGSQSYCAAVSVDAGTGSTTLNSTRQAILTVKIV